MTNTIQPKPLSPEQREEIIEYRDSVATCDRATAKVPLRVYLADTDALLSHIAFLEEESTRLRTAIETHRREIGPVGAKRDVDLYAALR